MVNQQLSLKLTAIYRHSTQSLQQSIDSLLNNLQRAYKESIDGQQTVITKTNCNLQAFYKWSTVIYK